MLIQISFLKGDNSLWHQIISIFQTKFAIAVSPLATGVEITLEISSKETRFPLIVKMKTPPLSHGEEGKEVSDLIVSWF